MNKKTKKKTLQRELIEWGVILGVFGFLYATGLHTELGGKLQGLFLKTGLAEADVPHENNATFDASYDFKIANLDGEVIDFEDFKGKTVFINFWATWCPPCIGEMPDIHDLYQDLKDNEDIVFVMLNVDNNQTKAKNFLERKGYEFPVYQGVSPFPTTYRTSSIPATYVISPSGKIAFEQIGIASYHTKEFKDFLVNLD